MQELLVIYQEQNTIDVTQRDHLKGRTRKDGGWNPREQSHWITVSMDRDVKYWKTQETHKGEIQATPPWPCLQVTGNHCFFT